MGLPLNKAHSANSAFNASDLVSCLVSSDDDNAHHKQAKKRKSVKMTNNTKSIDLSKVLKSKTIIGRKKRRNSEAIKKIKTEKSKKSNKRRNSIKASTPNNETNCDWKQNKNRKSIKIGRPKRRHSIAANTCHSKQKKHTKSRKHSVSTICRKAAIKSPNPYKLHGMNCQNMQQIGDQLRREEWSIGSKLLVA